MLSEHNDLYNLKGKCWFFKKEASKMRFLENMNKRVKKLSILDVKLVQGAAIFAALIIVKLFPQIMNINIWWFVVLLVLCVIKPFYVFYIKK